MCFTYKILRALRRATTISINVQTIEGTRKLKVVLALAVQTFSLSELLPA